MTLRDVVNAAGGFTEKAYSIHVVRLASRSEPDLRLTKDEFLSDPAVQKQPLLAGDRITVSHVTFP